MWCNSTVINPPNAYQAQLYNWNNVIPANVKLFMDNHLDAYLMGVKYQVTVPHMTQLQRMLNQGPIKEAMWSTIYNLPHAQTQMDKIDEVLDTFMLNMDQDERDVKTKMLMEKREQEV